MTCPHGPCHCQTPDGSYCGDYCREMTDAGVVMDRCQCGHPDCVAAPS